MIEEITIVGVKQYFEMIDGIKTFIKDEHIEITTGKNDATEVVEQYKAIEIIANK